MKKLSIVLGLLLIMAVGVSAELGEELITCGDFTCCTSYPSDCGTSWIPVGGGTTSWTVAEGPPNYYLSFLQPFAGFYKGNVSQTISELEIDKTYNVSVNVSFGINPRKIIVYLSDKYSVDITTAGVHTFLMTPTNNLNKNISIYGESQLNGQPYLLDVSVREVIQPQPKQCRLNPMMNKLIFKGIKKWVMMCD